MPIDRRSFLLTAAAAGVAARTGRAFAQPERWRANPAGSGPRILKSLKFGMIGAGENVREKFELARDAGFDGVELDSPSGLDLDEVVEARDAVGIAIPGVVDSAHWGKPFNHPDGSVRAEGRAALETAIRDCKKVGGSTVLVVPAVVRKGMSYADAYRLSQKEIGKLVPLAEELGVAIAFENVWNNFLLSPLEAARYVDEFESDHVGWYFDVGNIVNYAWPEQWIDALGARILKLDVKEFSRSKRDNEGLWKGFGVEIGEGDCDWPAVREALDRIGYRGWASAEVGGGGAERLADIARRMDQVLTFEGA
ncbi:MAG: sugar phosphate isomerase/epimerase family protein [Phycisphaerales bacterium JB058]